MRVAILIYMVLLSVLVLPTVSVAQQSLALSKASLFKSNLSFGFEAFREKLVGLQVLGNRGGGEGVI